MIRRIAALLMLLLLAACVSLSPTNTISGGRHLWTQPGHLRLGEPDEPDSLLEFYAHTAAADEINNLLFAPVFRLDDRGNFLPELARVVPSYANGGISRDSKTLVLHFRRGVVWADGAPLTAHDLAFTYRLVMNDRLNVKNRAGWDDIARIDLPDDYTAVVHLKVPNADVMGLCFSSGGTAYPPLPEHLLAGVSDLERSPYARRPVGSGPFALEKWNHGSSLEFVANPRYWRGRPKLDRITWKVIPNADTEYAQLQTHEIDVYDGVPENQVDRLHEIIGVTVTKRLLANERYLGINTSRPALNDVRVRLALAEAVNWSRINNEIYHGFNLRARSDIIPTSWAAPNVPLYPYDPGAARRLLDAAGWRIDASGRRTHNGRRLELVLSSGTNKPLNDAAEVQIQSELKALGIGIEIRNYPVNLLFDRRGPIYGGTYDLSLTIDTYGPDPDNEAQWNGAFIPPKGVNTSRIDDPVVNETSDAQLRTFDRAKRKALVQREELRLHELVPAVPLYWENSYAAYNDDLKNYKPAQFIANLWNSWEYEI